MPCLMKTLPENSTSTRPFSRPRKTCARGRAGRRRPAAARRRLVARAGRRGRHGRGTLGAGEACRSSVRGRAGAPSAIRTGCSARPGTERPPAPGGSSPGCPGALRAAPGCEANSAGSAAPRRGDRRAGVRRRPAGFAPACDLALHALHHEVRAGLAVLVDRVLVALQPLVDRAEVEVDLRVVLGQLERLEERRLRVLEAAELEADQPQVVVEGGGLGALRDQLAVDLLGLVELLLRK